MGYQRATPIEYLKGKEHLKRNYASKGGTEPDLQELMDYVDNLRNSLHFERYPVFFEEDWKNAPTHNFKGPVHSIAGESFTNHDKYKHHRLGENIPSTSGKRDDLAQNYQHAIDEWNKQRVASGNKGWDEQSFLRELDKLIRGDTERLSKFPRAQYQKKTPEMSMMTQKARDMKVDYDKKGLPYQNKINRILERGAARPGFEAPQIDHMAGYLREHSEKANDNIARRLLKKEFQDNYQTRDNILDKHVREVLDANEFDNRNTLGKMSNQLGITQQAEDAQTAALFKELGNQKKAARDSTIGALHDFGNQQHAYDELVERGNEKTHNIEAYLPYAKLEKFKGHAKNLENHHPGEDPHESDARNRMAAPMADYGMNGATAGKPSAQRWSDTRAPSKSVFTGSLVEELTPEILESQYSLQRLNPNLKTPEKVDLTNKLYGRKDNLDEDLRRQALGNVVYEKTMQNVPGVIDAVDPELKKAFKARMNQIAHKYIRLNQYGSPQQIRESERAAKDLTEKFSEYKSSKFGKQLHDEQELERSSLAANRQALSGAGDSAFREFNDVLSKIQATNATGMKDFRNNQSEKNKETNAILGKLGFDYTNHDLEGYFKEKQNPSHLKSYNELRDDLASRKPFSFWDYADLDKLGEVPFNQNEKATNNYASLNKNSLVNPYNTNYQKMKPEDKAQSELEYGEKKKQTAANKAKIAKQQQEERDKAMRASAEASRELGYKDEWDLANLLNSEQSGAYDEGELHERIADLLEKKAGYKFGLNPRKERTDNNPRMRSKYHPSQSNYNYIRQTANKVMSGLRPVRVG